MTLKSARIAKIENLSEEDKAQLEKEEGFAIIEIRNSTPKEEIKLLGGGIRDYLLSLGKFKEVEIEN